MDAPAITIVDKRDPWRDRSDQLSRALACSGGSAFPIHKGAAPFLGSSRPHLQRRWHTETSPRRRWHSESPHFAGEMFGIPFVLCPNSIAGVVASQNRHQFRVAVQSPDSVANRVVPAGGSIVNRLEVNGGVVIGVADPEGNTYELSSE